MDPDGMMPYWIPGMDAYGNLTLTAEEGDDLNSLKRFFKNDKNALKAFVKDKDLRLERLLKKAKVSL